MASTGSTLLAAAGRQPLAPARTYLAGAAVNVYYVAAIWLGMALLASVVSIQIAVPAALVEIVIGALAGTEIDPVSLRGHWKGSLSIGLVSFVLPFLAAFGFCRLVLGWQLHAAEI